jgi:O-antigen ligase
VAGRATAAAALVVPLGFLSGLATPFTGPKEAIFEVAGAVGLGALAVAFAAGMRPRSRSLALPLPSPAGAPAHRLVLWAALLVLASAGLSALLAAASLAPPRAPEAATVLVHWLALFGVAAGVALASGRESDIQAAGPRPPAGQAAPGARAQLLWAVTASAAVVSLIGLCQHAELFSLPIPVISTPGSTFGNRNLSGEAIALSLPLGIGALALAGTRLERRVILGALALEVLYLVATRARGAWLGAAVGVLTVAFLRRREWSRAALLPGLVFAGLALLMALLPARANPRYAGDTKRFARALEVVETSFDPESTAMRTRVGLWRRSLAMLLGEPLIGIGPGNWAVFFPRYAEPGATADGVLSFTLAPRHAHCDLLEHLTETGVLGLGALLALFAAVAQRARSALRTAGPETRATVSAAAGALVALLVCGLTGFPLAMPATALLAGVALGLVVGADGDRDRARPDGSAWSTSEAAPGMRRGPWAGRVGVLAALGLVALAVLDAETRLRASAWLGAAERALHQDRGAAGATRALGDLARADRARPGLFQVSLRRAHAEQRLHHSLDAVAACDAALAREPFSPNAWATLAVVQLDGGDPHSARLSAERSIELLGANPFALSVKARAAEALRDHRDAETAWARLAGLAASPPSPPEIDRDTARASRELLDDAFP